MKDEKSAGREKEKRVHSNSPQILAEEKGQRKGLKS